VIEDGNKHIICENKIARASFNEYILSSNVLNPITDENAVIEIVSPVLKKGKYKWTGIYAGEVIQFNMKSSEFKAMVQTGKIKFKNGSSVICKLVINRKIDNEGIVKVTGYDVVAVDKYYENDNPIETPEGKLRRQKKEADEKQLSLF
jgi:hypothetical protein